jgi:MFS family permease
MLIHLGHEPGAARTMASLVMWTTLVSLPLGGRVIEVVGFVTPTMLVSLSLAAIIVLVVPLGVAPAALCVAFGLFVGVPGGALMALISEAVTAENRGPGLGVFYTWYYVGMTAAPALAGWTRDSSGSASAPVIFAAVMLAGVVLCVGCLRGLQRSWPIQGGQRPGPSDRA